MLESGNVRIEYPENDKDGIIASMNPDFERNSGTLKVYPKFFNESLLNQENVIIHEVLHIVLSFYETVLEDMSKDNALTNGQYEEIRRAMMRAEEMSVVKLAYVIHLLYSKANGQS